MEDNIQILSFINSDLEFATHLTFDQDENLHMHSFYEIFYVTEGQIYHVQNGTKKLLRFPGAVFF